MAVSVALLKLPVLLLPRCPDQRAAETRPRARRHHLRYELCCGCFWQIVLGLGVVGVVGVVVPCAPARLPFAFCSRSSRTHSHSHTLTHTHSHSHTHTHSLTLTHSHTHSHTLVDCFWCRCWRPLLFVPTSQFGKSKHVLGRNLMRACANLEHVVGGVGAWSRWLEHAAAVLYLQGQVCDSFVSNATHSLFWEP